MTLDTEAGACAGSQTANKDEYGGHLFENSHDFHLFLDLVLFLFNIWICIHNATGDNCLAKQENIFNTNTCEL